MKQFPAECIQSTVCKSQTNYILYKKFAYEGQAWCSGESCLTESPGHGFEAASPQILWGKGLPRFFPSPDPTHVGASGIGSALFYKKIASTFYNVMHKNVSYKFETK